jgi:hypothetical protein
MTSKHSRRDWFSDFDFVAAIMAFLFGRGEPLLKPIPVRVRRRR